METKICILRKNSLFKRGDSFDKLDGVIVTSAPIAEIEMNKLIEDLDKGQLFPKCPHFYIRNDGIVYQVLPENYKVKYCGGYADKHYIQIVISEPFGIRYGMNGSFTIDTDKRARSEFSIVYESLVELVSTICKKYSFDPLNKDMVLSQSEAHARKVASDYPGIDHLLEYFGYGSMDDFRQSVNEHLISSNGYRYNGIDYSYVFDPDYYIYNNPNIRTVTGNDKMKVFHHFVNIGMKEGLQGNKEFNVFVYKNNNPDLTYGMELDKYYTHYCLSGHDEDRKCV